MIRDFFRLPGPFRRITFVPLAFLALLVLGCGDDVVNEYITEPQPNRTPSFLDFGPDPPPGGFEQISGFGPEPITLWAVVGDPDGIDDVVFVEVSVDTVRLNRFIVRPDTSSTSCLHFGYAPNDTLATAPILAVPATLPGFSTPLDQVQLGYFEAPGFGGTGYGFPDFLTLSAVLKSWPGGCSTSQPVVVGPIVVIPPAVPADQDVMISYVDLDYLGIRIRVFDADGASASVVLPSWHVVYTTPEERTALP